MPETQFSWSAQLDLAKNAQDSFTPLEAGPYNFEVVDPEVKTFENGNTVISYKAKVLDGPRTGATQFDNLNPMETDERKAFLVKKFFTFLGAVGIDQDQLIRSSPSLEQVAESFRGRKFTADVVVSNKTDKNGRPYRNLDNYRNLGVSSSTAAAAPAQAQEQAQTPPAPQAPAQDFSAPASSVPENPWG